MSDDNSGRVLPQSELDFNLMTTDPVWGSDYVNPELKKHLRQYVGKYKDSGGKDVDVYRDLWSILGIYHRDMRLANLSKWDGDYEKCEYWINFAADLLEDGDAECFITCMTRAATILELSQSKNGFLRKRMHTVTSENINRDNEPPKRGLFGQKKTGDD